MFFRILVRKHVRPDRKPDVNVHPNLLRLSLIIMRRFLRLSASRRLCSALRRSGPSQAENAQSDHSPPLPSPGLGLGAQLGFYM